jgi:hypothetical protein
MKTAGFWRIKHQFHQAAVVRMGKIIGPGWPLKAAERV